MVARFIRTRLVLWTAALAAAYYYLLAYSVGCMLAQHWPAWWFSAFPARHLGAVAWLVAMHTSGVLVAALPVAGLAVMIDSGKAIWIAAGAALLATAGAVLPSLKPEIWPLLLMGLPVNVWVLLG